MIKKFWNLYLLINYSAQRIRPRFFFKQSLITIIIFELSFLTSGIIVGIISKTDLRNPLIAAALVGLYALVLWRFFEPILTKKIDFKILEEKYLQLNELTRVCFFVLALISFIISFIFMIYSFKWVISILK